MVINDSKVADILDASSRLFMSILDTEDAGDGPTIEKVLKDMEGSERAPVGHHLLKQLFKRHQAQ